MEYRRLGLAGVQVSTISLGTWLTFGSAIAEDTAMQNVAAAYELGINFFDCSNAYAGGRAEEVLGRALKRYDRDTYVLATKVFFNVRPGPNGGGLSRKHIVEQCEASLRRLGVDYIDLYQCHRADPNTRVEETMRALDDLVTQGKVLYVGVSEWSPVQITDAVYEAREHNLRPLASNQPVYNMLLRYIERSILPICEREGIGQIVFSPLAQGVLTGKYKPGRPPPAGSRATDENQNMFMADSLQEPILRAVQRLNDLADELGYSLAQVALAWVLRLPIVSSAIIGASRPQQVQENAKAADITLSPDVLARIDEILDGVVSDQPITEWW